jgi:hypothetical protein
MLDIVSMRRQLRQHTGLDTDDLPDTDIDEKTGADTFLNRSYWEILDRFKFREKEKIVRFVITKGEEYYQTPLPFEAVQAVAIEDPDTKVRSPLDRVTGDVYEQKFINKEEEQGKPTHYLRENGGIRFWKTPDQDYIIVMRYWTVLGDLSDSSTLSPVPQAWHEVILMGAVWRTFVGVNSDYLKARAAKNVQDVLMLPLKSTDQKEQGDSHRSGLQVIGRDDPL